MEILLKNVERRVIGVLIEKELSQPDYYPMTRNALMAGCNQKQNRDPVTALDEEIVARTIEELRRRGLVTEIVPGHGGGRVNRYRHEAETALGWEQEERAVMAELLLRGPQTVGELRTRCSRMVPFENLESVAGVLQRLTEREPRLVRAVPREPGQSAVRYTHLLSQEDGPHEERPEPTLNRIRESPEAATLGEVSAPATPTAEPDSSEETFLMEVVAPPTPTADLDAGEEAVLVEETASPKVAVSPPSELEMLCCEVQDLRERITALTRRMEKLESRL